MAYVISNGKNYLMQDKNNRLVATTRKAWAKTFQNRQKAEHAAACLPKSMRQIGYKAIQSDNGCEVSDERPFKFDLRAEKEISWEEVDGQLASMGVFYRQILNQKAILEERLSQADKEIVDIEHAAEFFTLNAAQGYKLYKMLHDARVKRRECKDGLAKISCIMEADLLDYAAGGVAKKIGGQDSRKYQPRVLKELFESNGKGCIK